MNAVTTEASLSREPLEELMLAMDVVDTLRHSEGLVSRELNTEARREALVARLRDIYAAQGIAVSEAVLEQGVLALEEERFVYQRPSRSPKVWLAELYCSRSRWGKPFLLFVGLLAILGLGYYFLSVRPVSQERAELPRNLDTVFAQIVNVSKQDLAISEAQALLESGRSAIASEDYAMAATQYQSLRDLRSQLEAAYKLNIVTDPNENSGVWRVPAVNSRARNYYLIVEAVNKGGDRETVVVRNEEDGKQYAVKRWGVRVDEVTFEGVAADKQDDGIIQGNVIGRKQRGYLQPDYDIPTSGATITEW
ncbi:MAG: DUF6384 family protein [Pseudomonadales bacterium]